jgi:hypothetical protein
MNCNIPFPDLFARLEGTVCLYKGEPYLVRTNGQTEDPEDESGGQIYLYDLLETGRHRHTIQSKDPDFDIATPPLGYCQTNRHQVAYLSRRPWRKWKQGIIWDALIIEDISGGRDHFHFNSEAFRQTMAQEWMPVKMALKVLANEGRNYTERAINNDIALVLQDSEVVVFFRQERVGWMSRLELLTEEPTITVPTSRKAWVVKRYLQDFNFNIVIR